MKYKDNYYVNKINFYNIKKSKLNQMSITKYYLYLKVIVKLNGDMNLKREIKIVLF